MLGEAVEYPSRGDDALTTILVGGMLPILALALALVGATLTVLAVGLFVLPLAAVPFVLVRGYYVRVLRAVGEENPEPPAWDDWRSLFVDGLTATVISVAYALPLLVTALVVAVAVVVSDVSLADANREIAITAITVVGSGLLASYALVYAYVRPLAWATFARTDDLRAAFDPRTVGSIAVGKEYAIVWGLAFVVGLVGKAIATSLSPVLIGFFVGFYVDVVTYYLYARGVRKGLDASFGDGIDIAAPADPFVSATDHFDADTPDRSGPDEGSTDGLAAGESDTVVLDADERSPPESEGNDGWPDWDDDAR